MTSVPSFLLRKADFCAQCPKRRFRGDSFFLETKGNCHETKGFYLMQKSVQEQNFQATKHLFFKKSLWTRRTQCCQHCRTFWTKMQNCLSKDRERKINSKEKFLQKILWTTRKQILTTVLNIFPRNVNYFWLYVQNWLRKTFFCQRKQVSSEQL